MAVKLPKDWKAVDISQARGKARNRIYRVGLELEGGWNNLQPGIRLVHDGSVRFATAVPHIGEMPSPVLEVIKGSPTYWVPWLKVNYPHHINETCGMHVHMSFKTAFAYNRLMTPQFPATVVEEFKKWAKTEGLVATHPLMSRLGGNSRYCQFKFDADGQVMNKDKDHNQDRPGHRYTVINYCYGRYNTIECRLLPMMGNFDQAFRAVNELLEITNAFLIGLPMKREPKHILKHDVEDLMERTIIRFHV